MANICSVPGYKSNKNGKKVALFQFPVHSELHDKRYRTIPRQNWKVSKSLIVCEKHFHESDFKSISTDTCNTKCISRKTLKLRRVHLKPNVVPFFPSLFKISFIIFSNNACKLLTSSSSRHEKDNIILQKQNSNFLIQDSFLNFHPLQAK